MRPALPVWGTLLAAGVLFSGTTFVVKENGLEVGRYEASDGKNEIRVLENFVVGPAAESLVTKEQTAPVPEDAVPAGEYASTRIFWKWYLGVLLATLTAAFLAWKQKRDSE